MTDRIYLDSLRMNHFTEFDAELYCKMLKINPDDITMLDLEDNNLTDISGVSIFKNLEILSLDNNKNLKDLNFIKDLKELEYLYISHLNLTDESDTVDILKNLPNLKTLYCIKTFKAVDIKNELSKGIKIYNS